MFEELNNKSPQEQMEILKQKSYLKRKILENVDDLDTFMENCSKKVQEINIMDEELEDNYYDVMVELVQENEKVKTYAIETDEISVLYKRKNFKLDSDMIQKIIEKKGVASVFNYLNEEQVNEFRPIIKEKIDTGYFTIGLWTSDIIKNDADLMEHAMKKDIENINYVSKEIIDNMSKDEIKKAIENGLTLKDYSYIKEVIINDDDLLEYAIRNSMKVYLPNLDKVSMITIVPEEKLTKKILNLYVENQNPERINVPKELKTNKNMALALLENGYFCEIAQKMDKKILENEEFQENLKNILGINVEDFIEMFRENKSFDYRKLQVLENHINPPSIRYYARNECDSNIKFGNYFELIKTNKSFLKEFMYNLTPKMYQTLNFNDELTELLNEDVIYHLLENGYKISYNTPKEQRKYKYIKYAIEHNQPDALNFLELDEELEEEKLYELLKIALTKGYKINYGSPEKLRKYKYIKYAVESDNVDALNYLDFDEGIEEEKLIELVKLGLEKGYIIARNYSPNNILNIITNNQSLVRLVLNTKPLEEISIIFGISMIYEKSDNALEKLSKNEYNLSKEELEVIKYGLKYRELIELYGKEKLEDIYNLHFKDKNLCNEFFANGRWDIIEKMIKNDDEMINSLELVQLKAVLKHKMIDDEGIKKEYKKYLLENIKELDEYKVESLGDLLKKISSTNSRTLYSMRTSLATQMCYVENPAKKFDQIEKIYLKNNIPLYAKMFYCFNIIYPDLRNGQGNMRFDDSSRMSPELKDASLGKSNIELFEKNPTNNEKRFFIIYNDLLRNAVKSNSTDLRQYLDNIEQGNNIFIDLSNGKKIEEITEEEKEILKIFVTHLDAIYHNTKQGKEDNTDLSNYSLLDKVNYLNERMKPTSKYDLTDRIVRSFAYCAGYKSFKQMRDDMNETVKEADRRGRMYAEELAKKDFEFDDRDLVRCIGNYQALGGSLDNGNFSKEFLTVFRGKSDSDTTPLDIDLTLVEKKQTIYDTISNTPTGFGFGNIYLIIKKDNPNLNITRDEEGNLTGKEYDPQKLEAFGTKIEGTGGYRTHWGIRTGMSFTDVDYILYKEDRNINIDRPYKEDGTVNYNDSEIAYDDLSKVKFEIARHGYYIPVIDFAGKILFTPKEFDELREKMQGLKQYNTDEYNFSNNLYIEGVNQIIDNLESSKINVENKRKKIEALLNVPFSQNGLSVKKKIDGDLTPGSVEMIDTGSTGRGTNKINDGDFDFLLRIDQQIYNEPGRLQRLKDDISKQIGQYPYESRVVTDAGDFRYKKVKIDENTIVDIDLSFVVKTDKISYSTDECLKDRLKTIKEQDEEKSKLVVANIILGKEYLKNENCYKPSRSDCKQGGLGGAGVENWILQNGGSFYDAAESFLKASQNRTFQEFKKVYFIWDFGENHFAEKKGKYTYDNFIENMNDIGYDNMKKSLKKYFPDLAKKYAEKGDLQDLFRQDIEYQNQNNIEDTNESMRIA